jgi:hypothetical protein
VFDDVSIIASPNSVMKKSLAKGTEVAGRDAEKVKKWV